MNTIIFPSIIDIDIDLIHSIHLEWKDDDGRPTGYQRHDARQRAEKYIAASNFDPNLFEPLTISDRFDLESGKQYQCIDGQARLEMARTIGLTKVPCRVLTGLTYNDEPDYFVRMQTQRKSISPSQRFNAMLSVDGSWAHEASTLGQKYGLWFAGAQNNKNPNLKPVQCSATLLKLHEEVKKYNQEVKPQIEYTTILDNALIILSNAYPDEFPFSAATIKAMVEIVKDNYTSINEHRQLFVKKLRSGDFVNGDPVTSFSELEDLVKVKASTSSGNKERQFKQFFQAAWNNK